MTRRGKVGATLMLLYVTLCACSGEERAEGPPPVRQTAVSDEHETAAGTRPGLVAGSRVTATVSERADGRFDIDYVFAEPHSAMLFSRSSGDYRIGAWAPVTEGVELTRLGGFDALLFDAPMTRVSLVAEPRFVEPESDYSPFVAFSDGGLALFTGQFDLLPAADAAAIEALGGSLDNWLGDQPVLGVRVHSDRRIVFEGRVHEGDVEHTTFGSGEFVYLGDGEITEGRSYVGVLDRGLPDWILAAMETDMETIFSTYEARWSRPLEEPAVLYFAYGGDDLEGYSNKGSVAGTTIMLSSSGDLMDEPSDMLLIHMRWFFAHEVAHQFQNLAGQPARDTGESWIHEGGANTMANDIIVEMIGEDGPAWRSGEYVQAYSDCTEILEDGPLDEAHLRGQPDAFYACGSLIGLIADEGMREGDLYTLWQSMQASNGPMGAEAFYTAMEAGGASPDLVARVRRIVGEALDDPAAELRQAMDLAGIEADFNAYNQLLRLQTP